MHGAVSICPVHRYVPRGATPDYRRGRKSELIVVAAAKNNSRRVKRVKKFFAARVSAAVVTCDQKGSHPALKYRNDQIFDSPARIARQDHPGLTKRYLQHERDFVQVLLGLVFKRIPSRMEQPYSGLTDLHIFEQIGKCPNLNSSLQRDLIEAAMNFRGRRVIPGDSTGPKGPHVEIAKDEAEPERMVGVTVREGHVVQPADSLAPQKRSEDRASDIV